LSLADIKRRIKKFESVDKRLNIRKLSDFTLINDTYNANPDSMKMSLQLLAQVARHEKQIAILGDMFELGKQSKHLHESLAKEIIQNEIDSVYMVGKMMKHLYQKLKTTGIEAVYFEDRESLMSFLKIKSFANSVVLVKGSRGMKMEEFIDAINTN
jgi:UDP-N-acetylmuramyl pentapeptide synthase